MPPRTRAPRRQPRARGGQPTVAHRAQDLGPALVRFAVAVGLGDQLFGAVRADPDDDEGAQPILLEADVEVDAVDPRVDVVEPREIALTTRRARPARLRSGGSPWTRRARRQSPRTHRAPVRSRRSRARASTRWAAPRSPWATCASRPARWPRGEPFALAAVVDPRGGDLDHPRPGRDLPGPGEPVAHPPGAGLICGFTPASHVSGSCDETWVY